MAVTPVDEGRPRGCLQPDREAEAHGVATGAGALSMSTQPAAPPAPTPGPGSGGTVVGSRGHLGVSRGRGESHKHCRWPGSSEGWSLMLMELSIATSTSTRHARYPYPMQCCSAACRRKALDGQLLRRRGTWGGGDGLTGHPFALPVAGDPLWMGRRRRQGRRPRRSPSLLHEGRAHRPLFSRWCTSPISRRLGEGGL